MQFHVLSFEGPDRYAQAGGIASRVTGLTQALAEAGYETHLWFVGAPDLPGHESRAWLHLHRWCQWISRYHPVGVYDGEEGKRNQIADITNLYCNFTVNEFCKIFDNEDFGYRRITIERPLRDDKGKLVLDKKGNQQADSDLRDFENVPLKEDIVSFFLREARPFVADAWIDPEYRDEQDGGIGKVGYEINFNREFYRFQSPRSLAAIDTDLRKVEEHILRLLKEVTK